MSFLSTCLTLLVALSTCAHASPRPKDLCKEAESGLPGRVSYPGSPGYNESQTVYYTSQERDLKPVCVVRPQNTSEVSRLIKLIRPLEGDFVIRSGGHMLWSGAANMNGGMTVDLRSLTSFDLSKDAKIVKIGGGSICSELYPKLSPYNVTISAARLPGISVGGYLSGGGVGFFARSHGFSSENIRGYEIVLSSGRIVEATATKNSDLWVALRGGGNNFGIITRYDVETIPQGKFWGGQVAFKYTPENLKYQAKAFSEYVGPKNTDMSAMMGLIHVFQNKTYSLANAFFHPEGVANAPAFSKFLATPSIVSNGTATVENVGDFVDLFGKTLPVSVDYNVQLVFSFKNSDESLYTELWRLWKSGIEAIDTTPGLSSQFLIQPHPISKDTKNPFGLEPGWNDWVMATVTAMYPNLADDTKVRAATVGMIGQMEKFLLRRNVYIPFKYINYADSTQNAIASYGRKSQAMMRQVSNKYDDVQMFQKRVAGFKIDA